MNSFLEHRSPCDTPVSLFAWLVALAALVSGPLGFALVLLHPQPPWVDAATFAQHAHPIQQLPYWVGFGLLAACLLLVARLAALGHDLHRTRVSLALVLVAIYGAIIGINYSLQVSLVPYLAATADPMLGLVTMTNPGAPTWVLEMFGYAFLGFALVLVRPVIGGATRTGRLIRHLLVVNAVLSAVGAVVTAVRLDWVQTVPGLVSYLAWNGVFIALAVMLAIETRPRRLERFVRVSPM